jgi:CHAT domain-containing protein
MLAHADLVHYSGHGLDEDPISQKPTDTAAQTSIAIAPGFLKRCRLAVLSACRTLGTLSEREDALDDDTSFERIVLSSGAPNVIGALWDVDSAMTRKLMVRFYAELADHQTFAEALRRAQQQLQSDPASSHPYFWSTFQLVGQ